MNPADETPDRRSALPEGVVPSVSRRLRNLLVGIPTPFPCQYACFIHPRTRPGEAGFGVITLAGESLPLTVALLSSLESVPTLFEGRQLVVVGPTAGAEPTTRVDDEGWSVPLPVTAFSMCVMHGGEEETSDSTAGTAQIITRQHAGGPRLTLLCGNRPAGWPG